MDPTQALLAPNGTVAARAAMVLDLLLLDSAVHSFHGKVASSRGRSYGYGHDFDDQAPGNNEVLNVSTNFTEIAA